MVKSKHSWTMYPCFSCLISQGFIRTFKVRETRASHVGKILKRCDVQASHFNGHLNKENPPQDQQDQYECQLSWELISLNKYGELYSHYSSHNPNQSTAVFPLIKIRVIIVFIGELYKILKNIPRVSFYWPTKTFSLVLWVGNKTIPSFCRWRLFNGCN